MPRLGKLTGLGLGSILRLPEDIPRDNWEVREKKTLGEDNDKVFLYYCEETYTKSSGAERDLKI